MTPFTALYRKEFREHRTSFFVMLGCLALCLLLPLCFGATRFEGALVPYIYLYGFYVTAIAAMSYAKEEENKTSRFLRTLPVASGTILLAKLAWLGTAMAVLFLPAMLPLCVPFVYTFGLSGIAVCLRFYFWQGAYGLGFLALFYLVSWGFFWTTRTQNKLLAVLLSYACAFISLLAVGWLGLQYSMRYQSGQMEVWTRVVMVTMLLLIGLLVAVFGLWRAATFYSRAEPESKPEAFLNSERKDNDRRVRFVTRFFPRDRWTPFQALLWQAICQSRDILFLGLGTAIAFGLWQVFLSERFFLAMNAVNYSGDGETANWNFYVQIIGLGIICTGFLVAFGLGSSIFAQDQERGMYRALGQRGVSPRLVWWSRILPFLAVILVPVPFLVNMFFSILPERKYDVLAGQLFLERAIATAFILYFYLSPFCFGSFYSLFFRNVLVSMLVTFGTWLLYMFGMMWGLQIGNEFGFYPHLAWMIVPGVVPLLFPIASRLMTASWLREEPWSRRWRVPTLTLAVFAIYALGPVTVWGLCELLRYCLGWTILTTIGY